MYMKGLHKPLLGQPAIKQLDPLVHVETIESKTLNPTQQLPQLFKGLGQLKGDYKIELKSGSKPYALSTPRQVAIPFRGSLRLAPIITMATCQQSQNW